MPAEKPCPVGERKGVRMMPDNLALFATVILLLPMIYFLLAAPAFLLVRLDIPAVAQLLRAMFSGYFLTLAIAGVIGTIAVVLDGRLVLAIGIGLIAAFAASSRRWFLRQMDARLSDRDAGDADAVRRLRRLHWGGMLSNAIQLAAVVASILYIYRCRAESIGIRLRSILNGTQSLLQLAPDPGIAFGLELGNGAVVYHPCINLPPSSSTQ
jgi:hypothetical protein